MRVASSVGGACGSEGLRKPLRAIAFYVLAALVVAGLWPLRAPRNDVAWAIHGDGLRFGKHGSIVSGEMFTLPQSNEKDSCSFEIWLKPNRVLAAGTILAFYWPTENRIPVALRQSLGDLVIERAAQTHVGTAKIYVNGVFSSAKALFLTISSSSAGTTVYIDGIPFKQIAGFTIPTIDVTGQLILGNAPSASDSWAGQLKGLAIYDRELSASEVAEHFFAWTNNTPPEVARDRGAIATYLFDEGEGDIVHNRESVSTPLLIPRRFFIFHQRFLERPSEEYRPDSAYWEDVALNIGGFIPLGFFYYAYFALLFGTNRAVVTTIAMGFMVSLTIEMLQALLPTRNSGMTDLMSNTLGTVAGVSLCSLAMKRGWFGQVIHFFRFLIGSKQRMSDPRDSG